MSSQFASRADTREDGYNAARRGEGGKDDEFHAEDNPALMGMIERTQNAAAAQRNGDKPMTMDDLRGAKQDKRLWYEVDSRGGVGFAIGEVGEAETKHVDEVADDELEALRALRLTQMKARAAQEQEWKRLGHGEYTELHGDREFFEEVAKHDRVICALVDANAQLDTSIVHANLGCIAPVHLETKLCFITTEKAPLLSTHVEVEKLPVLFLVRGGKVVEHIPVDRSFTVEGVAHELSDKGFLDSDETTVHRTKGQSIRSSAATGAAHGARPDDDDDSDIDD